MPAPPKDQMTDANAPMATAKGDKKSDDRPHGPSNGNAKGIEQNGPDTANKDGPGAANSPDVPTKAGEMMDNAGTAKDQPDPGNAGHARSDETKAGKQETSWPDFAKLHDQISDGKDEDAKAAAGKVADIAKNSTDARKRDLAKEILAKNERDPKTGEKTKGPNLGGSGGPKKDDLPRDVKIAVANREFAAKIGQLQLDDWRKRLTPDLLKRAGLSDEDWQRYIKNAQAYDALVRQLNAQQIRNAQITAMRGKGGATPNTGARPVEGAGTPGDALGPGRSSSPPEVLPALPRFQSLIEPSKAEKSGVKNGK
jgi:hypothetical protein